MEQRPLRLGDIVDDYCPRERRITNHAVVAVVEDAIRQTRCTTCDAEHIYKHGREPRRRKKDETAYAQVLADVTGAQLVSARSASPAEEPPAESPDRQQDTALVAGAAEEAAPEAAEGSAQSDPRGDDIWPAHRQLIRATLPRVEGDLPPRPIPEFTMHQRPAARGNSVRFHGRNGNDGNTSRDGRGRGGPGSAHGNGQGPFQQRGGHNGGHNGGRSGRRRHKRSR
jgi:hypothetical protein